jgi:hypothetical protein
MLLLACGLSVGAAPSSGGAKPPAPVATEGPAAGAVQTEIVPLKLFRIRDSIYLPTVRSQRELTFTKPKTWALKPDSYLQVEFQHSHELQPHRSWLQILVNNAVIKHIPLTHENAEGTTVKIPLPVGALKDVNTLTFRVEQHYTDRCEDPLDPSLWTQVLPATQLVFHYTPVLPQVSLAQYPYPIIDPLTYSPARIRYVMPKFPSLEESHAMTLVNLNLGQGAQKKQMETRLSIEREAVRTDEHLVYIGTPVDNPNIGKYVGHYSGYGINGNSWVNKASGETLGEDAGLIFYFPDPAVKGRAILVVTGNGPQGVLRAARYLTTPGKSEPMSGQVALVDPGWSPSGGESSRKPRFIDHQNRTFAELELITEQSGYQQVEKIHAPPLVYPVNVVGDFRKEGTKLWLDLVYSYGPGLNPEFSSLELRMNRISIGNIPLTNPEGEENVRASIPISNELIHPRNELVAQFHMLPDKYGYCVDTYVDKAWGRIHQDSTFRVEGPVGPRLPDLTYLGDIGFPFTRHDNLQESHFILPKQPSRAVLQTLLGFTTRLGRDIKSDTDLRFTMGEEGSSIPTERDILSIVSSGADGAKLGQADGLFLLTWPLASMKPLLKQFKLADNAMNRIQDSGMAGYMEQRANAGHEDRVTTVLTAKRDEGLLAMARLFENDEAKAWEAFTSGSLKQLSVAEDLLTAADYPVFREEKARMAGLPMAQGLARGSAWYDNLPLPLFLGVMLLIFMALVALPVIIRKMGRR